MIYNLYYIEREIIIEAEMQTAHMLGIRGP